MGLGRGRGQLHAVLVLGLAGAALAATYAGEQEAHACSCARFAIGSVVPENGSTGVHPRSHIVFTVGGRRALDHADELRGDFRLLEEQPSGAARSLAIDVVRTGNLVRVVPRAPLRAGAWYRLERPGVARPRRLTRFQAGPDFELPEPARAPEIRSVGWARRRAGSSTCAGRSSAVGLQLAPGGLAAKDMPLFSWKVMLRDGERWVPVQGAFVDPEGSASSRRGDWRSRNGWTLIIASRQCRQGPVIPRGQHMVKIALVRADGRQWESLHGWVRVK